MRTTNKERGVALGVVLVLMVVLLMAAGIAVWGLRSETASSGTDRLSRQLQDCAEQVLAAGKIYFSNTNTAINNYLSTNVCSTLPCVCSTPGCVNPGPFHAPPSSPAGTPVSGYPNSVTYQPSVTYGSITFNTQFAIYDDADETGTQDFSSDTNNIVGVWASCTDPTTNMRRTATAIIQLTGSPSSDYAGQAGRGFRNQGNAN